MNCKLLVALWPVLVDTDREYPLAEVHRKIKKFCAGERIAFHDLLQNLRGHRDTTLWVHPADHHPNEIADAIAARSLAPIVRDLVAPGRHAAPR
jgi:hypothetical protein